MAFTFGTGARPTFGAAATTAPTGLFGSTATTTPATGFAFGTGAVQNQSTGFGFGSNPAAAPSTGFGFNFGSTSASAPTLGFGTATTAPSAGGFGFGLSGSTGTASTGFGTLGGGSGSGFGTATSGTGFGTGAFGTALSTGTPSFGFGSGGTMTGFGAGTAGSTSGFGTGLGAGTFTGFGTGLGTGSFGTLSTGGGGTGLFGSTGGLGMTGFGANSGLKPGTLGLTLPAAATQVSQPVNITATTFPVIFNDERDMVIAKWNQLQACWGTGKGFYGGQPGQWIQFTANNPHCFFKAVGYSCIPQSRNEDGLVSLTFSKKQSEVCDNQQLIVDALHRFLGSKPNIMVCVDGVKPLADDRTEMVIYVQDRQVTGQTTRVPATEVGQFLNQDLMRNQLSAQLCIVNVFAKVCMSPDQLKLYLNSPPAGIDSRIWEQAKLDNPNPDKLLPVPMVGFAELYNRLKQNEQEAELHQTAQDMIASNIVQLQNNMTSMIAKTEQAKRRQTELGHRLLKVIVRQEIHRKNGYAIQADEEALRAQLEALVAELNSPTQLKGRLNEIMSQMRMQNLSGAITRPDVGYQIDPNIQEEIKQHLKQQHESITYLIDIIKGDLDDVKLIEQDLGGLDAKVRR